jgi:hypothetical protein
MDTKLDRLSPGREVYQHIIDKIAARDLFDRVFIEVYEIERINNTKKLNNGDKLKYAIWVNNNLELLQEAISSGFFSRIHASNRIAYKANDVHAGGVSFFSAHPAESEKEWDVIKTYPIDGVSTDKADVTLFIMEHEIPTCRIMVPVNGAVYNVGETITLKADVGDSDSSITEVQFYCNGNMLGQDISAPFTYTWTDVTGGRYALTARVFDNGMSKMSVPVDIHVKK